MHLPDFNRSSVRLLVQGDTAGTFDITMWRKAPGQGPLSLLAFTLDFVEACDDSFCEGMNLITNWKLLQDQPSVGCSLKYCLDPNLLQPPKVLEFNPTEGSERGGTLVSVVLQDFPAFSRQDLTLKVKSSDFEDFASVETIECSEASTLISSLCELSFYTPEFPSTQEVGEIIMETVIAGQLKSAAFKFEFLPFLSDLSQFLSGAGELSISGLLN